MKKLFKTTHYFTLVLAVILLGQVNTIKAQNNPKSDIVYIKIEINGMACPYCAYGMEKELKKVSGVDDVKIKLKEGLAYIATPKKQKPLKESLALIISNAGFTPGTIEFSDNPFVLKEDKAKE